MFDPGAVGTLVIGLDHDRHQANRPERHGTPRRDRTGRVLSHAVGIIVALATRRTPARGRVAPGPDTRPAGAAG